MSVVHLKQMSVMNCESVIKTNQFIQLHAPIKESPEGYQLHHVKADVRSIQATP